MKKLIILPIILMFLASPSWGQGFDTIIISKGQAYKDGELNMLHRPFRLRPQVDTVKWDTLWCALWDATGKHWHFSESRYDTVDCPNCNSKDIDKFEGYEWIFPNSKGKLVCMAMCNNCGNLFIWKSYRLVKNEVTK